MLTNPIARAAIFFLLTSTIAMAGPQIKNNELRISNGKPTVLSGSMGSLIADERSVGYYSIHVEKVSDNSNIIEAAMHAANLSDCSMRLGGTFYSDGKPIDFVDWGAGVEIKSRGNWRGTGGIVLPPNTAIFSFKPDGYLFDCPKGQPDFEQDKKEVYKKMAEVKAEYDKTVTARTQQQPKKGNDGQGESAGEQVSCSQCRAIAERFYTLDASAFCKYTEAADFFLNYCAHRGDCRDPSTWDSAINDASSIRARCR